MVSGLSAAHSGLTSVTFTRVSGRSREYKTEMEESGKESWKRRGERSWPSRRLGMETVEANNCIGAHCCPAKAQVLLPWMQNPSGTIT